MNCYSPRSRCQTNSKAMVTLLNDYLRETFGCKVYKIALNGGFTCPNRDGSIGTGGCIFCSEGGSGEFASNPSLSVTDQIDQGKKLVSGKNNRIQKEVLNGCD